MDSPTARLLAIPSIETRFVATTKAPCATCGETKQTYRMAVDDGHRYCGRHIDAAVVAATEARNG